MKRFICLLLVCLMAAPLSALAEDASAPELTAATANAVAECVHTYDLTAPFAGVLQPFNWEKGDRVSAGDALFTLDTAKVYAPDSGTLYGLFVKEGDLCEDAMAQYGRIASIEKDPPLVIDASTKGAYKDDDNKIIHLGATVYFEQSNDGSNEGEGRVIAVNGNRFTVEMTAGDFVLDDKVRIYREEKMGNKTKIGEGTFVRGADLALTGSGRVLKCYFRQGQRVNKGDLLFELISSESDPGVLSARVTAPASGVLSAPKAVSGQQAYKGQVLITVHDLSEMRVVAEVDEMDLDKVRPGASLTVVFDRYPNESVPGTVTDVSGMGNEKQNASYYDVNISFTTSLEVLPGMNATAYLPADK